METKLIYEKMVAIMQSITAIEKDKKNLQQGFNFRGIDDVINELHSIFAINQVFITTEILEHSTVEKTTKSGGVMNHVLAKCKFTLWTIDGSSIDMIVIGEAMDSGDKATNKAMSIGLKYALLQAFLIPTKEDKDPDAVTPEPLQPKPEPKPEKKPETNDLPWLNKFVGKTEEISQEWENVCKFIREGGNIDKVKTKFKVSKVNFEELTNLIKK